VLNRQKVDFKIAVKNKKGVCRNAQEKSVVIVRTEQK